MNYYIRVRSEEQLEEAAAYLKGKENVTFMLPVDMESAAIKKAAGFMKVADLPYVARENIMRKLVSCIDEACWADAFTVKNIDELGLLESRKYDGSIIADSFLYASNNQAMEMYKEHFKDITFMTSDELTDVEIFKMAGHEKFIYKAYGRARLMITAQSLAANFKGDEKAETVTIESLKHDRFVSCDESFGYSILYTKDPVSMLDKMHEIECENILIDFTLERRSEVKEVLECVFGQGETTDIRSGRGHHYKGID